MATTTKYKTNQYDSETGKLIDTQDVCKKYSAIVNKTDSLDAYSLNDLGDSFIIGEYYTLDTYESDDDFSNIADVIEGDINSDGCYFRATGTTPTNWDNNSYIYSDGSFVVNELENTLGVNIYWDYAPFGGEGYGYVYAEDYTGNTVDLKDLGTPFATIQNTQPFVCCYPLPIFYVQYDNWYPAMYFETNGFDGNGYVQFGGMLWNSSFELKVFPNGGNQDQPLPMLAKPKLKMVSDTPRTKRVPFSGVTESNARKLINEAKSTMTKEQFHALLKSRRQ
jgi:hypothetical protein